VAEMATRLKIGYAEVAGGNKPVLPISETKQDKRINNFVVAVKKSELAIKTAIKDIKRELITTLLGGNNGGVAGGMI
jgi:hypothetical protein